MQIGKYEIGAFLFDKDGTIFDSEAMHCQGWIVAAKKFNVHFTAETYRGFIGMRIEESYQKAQKLFGEDFVMDEFITFYEQWVDEKKAAGVDFKLGFEAFFSQLKQANLPIALVTSANKHATELSFKQFPQLKADFQLQVTGDDVAKPKPDPSCYLKACQQLGLAPENTLAFEDSIAGVTAAVAAGCQTVVIPDILPIPEELLEKCAYVFDSFEQAMVLFE